MPLSAGVRLGPYEVVALLGVGGMGEVYRARDTRLDRDVAIKVLPEQFLADPERIARFQREAKTLASLSHPNIGGIYGLEDADGVKALVLELVEGPTLDELIGSGLKAQGSGGLAVDEALKIAQQIAEALEAAHEQGIVHRDLKPANIKVRADGTVKVLDFGLAKAMDQTSGSGLQAPAMLTQSPTITTPAMTLAGVILGTAAYMSPEQAKGRPADKRSDIWAFGCVLFEMLTGKRAFEGEDVSDTLAVVLRGAPDWDALPSGTPAPIVKLIRGCLQKDRRERVPDIAVARLEIKDALTAPPAPTATIVVPQASPVRQPLWKRTVPFLATAAVAGALAASAIWSLKPTPAPKPIMRFVMTLGEGQQFTSSNTPNLAISPDGTRLAYVANSQMYLRAMSDLDARPIPGTLQAASPAAPVFSPDGQSIAFFSAQENIIKKVAVSGGATVTLCPARAPLLGMSWDSSGILFGQSSGILRVSENGGQPEILIASKAEVLAAPQMLPGGEWVLFTNAAVAGSDGWDKAKIVVQSLKSSERKTLLTGGSDARYLPTGHLLYALAGVMLAVPFDLAHLAVDGGPVPVVEGVRRSFSGSSSTAQLSVSSAGALVFVPGPTGSTSGQADLALFDRAGGPAQSLKLPPNAYLYPRLSPDGKTIAIGSDNGKEAAVWIYDPSGATSIRQLTLGGQNKVPVWAPDGQHVAFQSDREGDLAIWWQRVDGTTAAERLTTAEKGVEHVPESWAGQTLLVSVANGGNYTLAALNMTDRKMTALAGFQSAFPEEATFSPDGKWLAYSTAVPGAPAGTLFVQPFPPTNAPYPISKGTGVQPAWSPDGKELFYSPGVGQEVVVAVTTKPSFTFGNPVPIARTFPQRGPTYERAIEIMPDGKHILAVSQVGTTAGGLVTPQIQVWLNWFEELKAKVPAGTK